MLEEIKTFLAVVKYKNFTKAAESINLSQPSVSLHIKHLEEYFNVTLIKRSIKQKNIIITKSGELLYERAKEMVSLIEDTKNELLDLNHEIKGELRIGASYTIGEYFLPAFLGSIKKEFPDIKFDILIQNTANICEKVQKLEVDIGLIEGTLYGDKFIYDEFYKDNMVVAAPYYEGINDDKYSAKNLSKVTWITREKGSGTREYLDIFLSENNIVPNNLIVFGSNFSVKEAVKNNLGITFISEHIAKLGEQNKEVKIINTEKKYCRAFLYILPKNIKMTMLIKVFIEKLKQDFSKF